MYYSLINVYPDGIANLEVNLLHLADKVETQSNAIEDYNAAIEVAIATDAELKNDQHLTLLGRTFWRCLFKTSSLTLLSLKA